MHETDLHSHEKNISVKYYRYQAITVIKDNVPASFTKYEKKKKKSDEGRTRNVGQGEQLRVTVV